MTDQFWQIFESEKFKEKFRDFHPVIKENGREFYRVENLKNRMVILKSELLKARTPKSDATLRAMLASTKDWIKQAEWIEQKLEHQSKSQYI